jgi:ATP-binding cassette subfamily F protein 3
MMKLLAGAEPLTAGERKVGEGVRLGYFAQNLAESLDYETTVLNELSNEAEGMTSTEIRSLLGAMLFSGDEVEKRVGVLSGGERARLSLAKVLAHRNNCLLLDEPTNNLDIVAKDTLLEALRRFPGTVVIVSHDRYLLNELVTEVVEVGHGQAIRYLGNYDDYLAKKEAMESGGGVKPGASAASKNGASDGRNGRSDQTRRDQNAARKRDRDQDRRRGQLAQARLRIESGIEQMERERANLTAAMNEPDFYLNRPDANELIVRYEKLGGEIERLYEELLELDKSAPASN